MARPIPPRGIVYLVTLPQEGAGGTEGEFIACDYLNYPRCIDCESLEHMLESTGIQTSAWGLDGKSFPKEQKDMSTKL